MMSLSDWDVWRHQMLLTDVAGVVFLVVLSLPPASMDVTVRFVLLFLRERVRLVGKKKGWGVERL